MPRLLALLLMAVLAAAPLAACGKKGDPIAPKDSQYPRKYPSQ